MNAGNCKQETAFRKGFPKRLALCRQLLSLGHPHSLLGNLALTYCLIPLNICFIALFYRIRFLP